MCPHTGISTLAIIFPRKENYELLTRLKKEKFPFICLNLYAEKQNKNNNYLNIDYQSAFSQYMDELFKRNKRNIALVKTDSLSGSSHNLHHPVCGGYEKRRFLKIIFREVLQQQTSRKYLYLTRVFHI